MMSSLKYGNFLTNGVKDRMGKLGLARHLGGQFYKIGLQNGRYKGIVRWRVAMRRPLPICST